MKQPLPPLDSVLIVMLTAIGDAVHVLPVVRALKRHHPQCRITWVLQPGPAKLIAGHPDVDEIVVFERSRGWRGFLEVARTLRARRFDVLLDLQLSFKAGLITRLSGAPVRVGYDRGRARDLNTLFTNRRIPARPLQHVQDEFLEFVQALGVAPEPIEWNLGPWPHERPWQRRFFAQLERPAATLVIATSNPLKDWLPPRWAALADVLYDDFGLQPVVTGGGSARERAIAGSIAATARNAPVAALGISLRELVALIDGSAVVISLDTGPMHIAVALERPVIALMGYKDPRRVGPYRRYHDLIVDAWTDEADAPITRENRQGRMARITVADVTAKVALWKRAYAARPA
jgi:heptosyltransferase I